jgi:hypothetical protein
MFSSPIERGIGYPTRTQTRSNGSNFWKQNRFPRQHSGMQRFCPGGFNRHDWDIGPPRSMHPFEHAAKQTPATDRDDNQVGFAVTLGNLVNQCAVSTPQRRMIEGWDVGSTFFKRKFLSLNIRFVPDVPDNLDFGAHQGELMAS